VSDPRETIAALAARAGEDASARAALVDWLGADCKPVQRAAADALLCAAEQGAAADVCARLVAALGDASPRRRWGAAWTLSLLGPPPPACLPVLVDVIGHADGDLRWAAAAVLLAMRDEPTLVPRLVALAGDGNPVQRKMALYCLRDLDAGGAEPAAAARRALDDPDAGVRLAALAAALRLGGDAHTLAAAVAARLDDADAGVRRAAAATLGRLGVANDVVRAALARAIDGDDAALARAARAARTRLGG